MKITIQNAIPAHSTGIYNIIVGESGGVPCEEDMTPTNISNHIRQFSEGQFVALSNDQVVGFAITMRTNRNPNEEPLSWHDMVGNLDIVNHNPFGEWLYGIDFAVDRNFRRRGIGTKMYQARFNLVKRLNLRGFYAGGMLVGYRKYQSRMSVREYARRVIRGELKDPTVTMQMNRGFKPRGVIENYSDGVPWLSHAMLLVWNNPKYQAARIPA